MVTKIWYFAIFDIASKREYVWQLEFVVHDFILHSKTDWLTMFYAVSPEFRQFAGGPLVKINWQTYMVWGLYMFRESNIEMDFSLLLFLNKWKFMQTLVYLQWKFFVSCYFNKLFTLNTTFFNRLWKWS